MVLFIPVAERSPASVALTAFRNALSFCYGYTKLREASPVRKKKKGEGVKKERARQLAEEASGRNVKWQHFIDRRIIPAFARIRRTKT